MKKSLLSIICLLCAFNLFARPISPEQALSIAQNVANNNMGLRNATDFQLVHTEYTDSGSLRNSAGNVLYYIYNVSDDGFVIVAGDDVFAPVMGYSFSGAYQPESSSPAFDWWLEETAARIEQLILDEENSNRLASTGESDTFTAIPAMLETEWGQSSPYNQACPLIGEVRAQTGCIATVMAQVMKFHQHPQEAVGHILPGYTTTTLNIAIESVDLSAFQYDWNNMTPSYSSETSTETQIKAVSNLMYHCGVSVQMDYLKEGSGATLLSAARALMNYFDYDKAMTRYQRKMYEEQLWKELIINELNNQRPLIYSGMKSNGVGHAFICDGMDSNGLFHINWGWNVYQNGFFNLDGIDYNADVYMLTGIQPNQNNPVKAQMVIADAYPLACNVSSVIQNDSIVIQAGLANVGMGEFQGNGAFLLTDANDNVIETLAQLPAETIAVGGGKVYSIKCQIKSAILPGDYQIRVGVKDNESADYQLIYGWNGATYSAALQVIGDGSNIDNIDANVSVRYADGMLTIDSPYSETIQLYSLNGWLLKSETKTEGAFSLAMNELSNQIVLLKGSSGWVKKVVIKAN